MFCFSLFFGWIFFIFEISSGKTIERCNKLQITYAAKYVDPYTFDLQLLQEYNTTLEFTEGENSTTLFMFSNITTFHLNSTYEFEMKTKFYIGYGDEDGYYNSVYDCKRGINNSCNSSVPYISYYEFVPSNGSSCFTFGNPIFYKGDAFQSTFYSTSNDDGEENGQIIGTYYSEMKPDIYGCNSSDPFSNVIYYLQQYCTNIENYTLSAQTSTCDSFNASFEVLNGKAQLAAGSIKIDFDDILSRLNITLINGTILKNSILNCTAPNCGFYLNSNLGMCQGFNACVLPLGNLISLDFIPGVIYPNGSFIYIESWGSAVLKYFDGIFYMDDDTPFSKESPCFNNSVLGFLESDIEIFENNLITKSQICCANWKPLNQLRPITTTRMPIAPEVNQVSQCSALSVNYYVNITGHTSNVSANIQFSPENSTTLFYITNISISNHIPGYDFYLFFLTDTLLDSVDSVDFNPNPLTQKISIFNESEFAISMPGISTIGFGINGNYTTFPESIGELSFYKGNVLDKCTNGYYFDGWSSQCTSEDFYGSELGFKWTTCCINNASISSPEQTPQQTCRRFNAIIDWFTKDGIVFNELRANISADFDDSDNKDTLAVISSIYYPQSMYDVQMDINLIIDRVLIDISSDQEGQIAVPNIGHFVFIDALIIVTKLNTSDLLYLATTSAISIYKHSSVYYNDDGSPFSEENPCATRDVEVFSNKPHSDEYAGMTSKSRICCTDWQPIAQNFTATTTPSKKPPKSIWLILLYIFISILIVGMLISIIVIIRWYRKKKHQKKLEDLEISMQRLSKFPNHNNLEQKDPYLIDENKLQINFTNPIGKGFSSTVYQAHLEGPSPLSLLHKSIQTQRFQSCNVAIKIAGKYGNDEEEMLLKEIDIMKQLGYHEHIIAILGWFMHGGERTCAVFELATGDLLSEVKRRKENEQEKMNLKEIFSILWQIARGMQYIASKQMVHRDLAARNILLTGNHTAKISDFGLCCTCDDSLVYQASRQKKLPMKWLSIEAITERKFSEKSDVWSFGVLMYEIFSGGKIPYTTMNNDEMLEFLQEGSRLECPKETPEEVYEIMLQCWNKEPVNRPNFEELIEKFRNLLNTVTESYGYCSESEFQTTSLYSTNNIS